jgi:hypothetical protein
MGSTETLEMPKMQAEPQKAHQWLQQLVGEWTYQGEAVMGPDQPSEAFNGSETVRSLGGLWVIHEGRGEMPDGDTATTVMTLGYDPQQKRFVGTFIASMMTYLWVYDGELDEAERVLTLYAQGPDMTNPEKMAKFKDVIELRSEDHRVMTSHYLDDGGTWHRFMTAHYRRT